jgi:hypothetical protein
MSNLRKWVIPVEDIPNNKITHTYFFENTDLISQISKFKKSLNDNYVKCPLNLDTELLKHDVLEAIDSYGLYPFSYNNRVTEEGVYISSSLTWNPRAIDKISDNPHQSTLGSSFHNYGSASLYANRDTEKNSYTDSLAFTSLTPFAEYKSIKDLTSSFKRTLVRSRVSVLIGGDEKATKFNFGWHNDELIFVNLRVNVPVTTNPFFSIQIIQNSEGESLNIQDIEFELGHAYAYDTSKNHRPFCRKVNNFNRINMIYGVSPWFDFVPGENVWISNEYYGEIHPFEMLRLGLISNKIKT